MNIPEEQRQQILDSFYFLCDSFLPSSEVRKKIKVVFQKQDIEGKTFFNFQEKSFIISFWNQEYKSHDFLLKVVAHEFTHIIFFLIQAEHHNWIFFVYVEVFYYWLKAQAEQK